MKSSFFIALACVVIGGCTEELDPLYVNGGKKLEYYIETFESENQSFLHQTKMSFNYDSAGAITRYSVFGYNSKYQTMEEQYYFIFSRHENKVDSIKGFLNGAVNPYIEYRYLYNSDGSVAKIVEVNQAAGVNSEASFAYSKSNEVIVSYTYSNGNGFEYKFNNMNGNILQARTTIGTNLCNEGSYTYDQHINPLNNLGYVDYNLINWSVNNRLTESVNYLGCSFPSLRPEFYSYKYTEDGFPQEVITYYKGGAIRKSIRQYFYK